MSITKIAFGTTNTIVLLVIAAFSNAQTWKDVPNTDPAYAAINAVDTNTLMKRCSDATKTDAYFCPKEFVHREDFAISLVRASRGTGFSPSLPGSKYLADVPIRYGLAPWIYRLHDDQIRSTNPNGCTSGSFCPFRPITRAEAIELMVKTQYFREGRVSYQPPVPGQSVFTDVDTNHWAARWINEACNINILTFCDSGLSFSPENPLSRSDAAVWLNRKFNGTSPNLMQLTIAKNGTGSGTVNSDPANIDCGATCNAFFATNSSVTLSAAIAPGSYFAGWSGSGCSGLGACTVTMSQARTVTATFNTNPSTGFYTVTPCRVIDTRNPDGPLGGPILAANTVRTFTVVGTCDIPSGTKAISVNITTVNSSTEGSLVAYPGDEPTPNASAIMIKLDRSIANNGSITLARNGNGSFAVRPDTSVHFIIDVNGYFK